MRARLPESELTPVEFYPVEVTFAAIADAAERRFFNDIGTNYSLSDEQVTRLIELGPKLLDASPVFRALVDRLKYDGLVGGHRTGRRTEVAGRDPVSHRTHPGPIWLRRGPRRRPDRHRGRVSWARGTE